MNVDTILLVEELCACEIQMHRLVHLGSLDGLDMLGEPHFTHIAVAESGQIAVGGLTTGGEVRLFDPEGRVEGLIGGTGPGPGEQGFVTGVHYGPGDTLYVIDAPGRTMNRYAPSGEFLDRTLLPGGFRQTLPLGGRRLLLSGAVRETNAIGFPLHVTGPDGIEVSFGEEEEVDTSRNALRLMRLLASRPDGRVWAARQSTYEISEWLSHGVHRRVLVREADWFLAGAGGPSFTRTPPGPQINGIWVTPKGQLWVHSLIADPDWRPATFEPDPSTGVEMLVEASMDPFYDSVIEVIDLAHGTVLARVQSDLAMTPIGGTDHGILAFSYEEDDRGVPRYDIWSFRLER